MRCLALQFSLFFIGGAVANAVPARAESTATTTATGGLAGYFESDSMRIYCQQEGPRCTGTIDLGGKTYPLLATPISSNSADRLAFQGQFHDGARPHDFLAVVEKNRLTFESGGVSTTLTRKSYQFDGLWYGKVSGAVKLSVDGRKLTGTLKFNGTRYTPERVYYLVGIILGDRAEGHLAESSEGPNWPFTIWHKRDQLVIDAGEIISGPLRAESESELTDRYTKNLAAQFRIAPQWKSIQDFSEGRAAVQGQNELWGFIDNYGKQVVPCQYKEVRSFHAGLAGVKIVDPNDNEKISFDDKRGYIDAAGNIQIPIEYVGFDFEDFSEGLCLVNPDNDDNVAFINVLGRVVIGPYRREERSGKKHRLGTTSARTFSEGVTHISKSYYDGSYCRRVDLFVIDSTGRVVFEREPQVRIQSYSEGLAAEDYNPSDEKLHSRYLDLAGNPVLDTRTLFGDEVTQGESFHEKVAVVRHYKRAYLYSDSSTMLDKKTHYKDSLITKKGQVLFSTTKYKFLNDAVSGGLMIVEDRVGGKGVGALDRRGNLVIPCRWSSMKPFSEGLAAVENRNGKWGFVDRTGKLVVPCVFEDAESFNEGLAFVKDNRRWGCIGTPLLSETDLDQLIGWVANYAHQRQQELRGALLAQQQQDAQFAQQRLQLPFADGAGRVGSALEGYCPVTMFDEREKKKGNFLFREKYQGRTYTFAGFAEERTFKKNPEKYAAPLAGFDPVKFLDEGRWVPGKIKHSKVMRGTVVSFADEESQIKFDRAPHRYLRAARMAMQHHGKLK